MAIVPLIFWIISTIFWEIIYIFNIKRTLRALNMKNDEKIDDKPWRFNSDVIVKDALH